MTQHDVVISGLGLVTPSGVGVDAAWKAALTGEPAARSDPAFADADLDVTVSCRVPAFDPDEELGRGASRRLDRFVHLALLAAREAVVHADLDDVDPDRVGIVLGCGIGGTATWEEQHLAFQERGRTSPLMIPKMLSNMAAGQIAIEHGLRGPNLTINTACASGASAIHVARELLRSGAADAVLAGGTEAGITTLSAAAFNQMGALSRRPGPTASRPFDQDRDGFVMGEGAGVLVLERADDARARGVSPVARVAGGGASADAHHQTAPPDDGGGAVLAMRRAIEDADIEPTDVDHVNAHGTSTPLNDVSEARALRVVLGDAADDVAVTSTKGVTGHLLGAAGAVEAAFGALAIRDGMIPPTANLEVQDPEIDLDIVRGDARRSDVRCVMSNSFGFGGQNQVLVLTA